MKRGEITTQHLYQQLANPALQHRHREMLLTIVKIQSSTATTPGYGPSPRVSPVPPSHHHIFQQQQPQQQPQQLRVSPLPPNGESRILRDGFLDADVFCLLLLLPVK